MLGTGQRCRVAPDSPTCLGLWVVSEDFQRFFYYQKWGQEPTQENTRNPKVIWCRPLRLSGTGALENPLALKVGICVVAAQALRVLAHVAAFWAGLR